MRTSKALGSKKGCGLPRIFTNAIVATMLLNRLIAFPTPAKADEPAASSPDQRAAHLERMREIARSISLYELAGERQVPAQLVDEPVLRYADSTRDQYDSTIWVWGAARRPTAIMAIEYYPQRPKGPQWLFEIASLSAGRIAAERGKELHWTAREPGLQLQPLADVRAPAEGKVARLAQMKQLQRRFAAYERATIGGRIELRPIARPLHRYHDDAAGVIDGAVFAFANGTNPEVLWIIEASSQENSGSNWQVGLVQLTGEEVFVERDGKQIWSRGLAEPPAERESYVNGWLAPAAEAK